jgi:NADPH:quinone reductase-like Zn-dependent oxidoreductase
MLKGFHYPLTPKGKSTLNPPPPWYYSADFLNIELWSDPAAVAAVLPPVLDPDPAAEGNGNALFYDWQFSGANEEYLDPARYQYREFFLLFDALFKGKPVAYCPYIFVDNDAAIHAAAGGVGFLLTQMAKLCGARVFATVSTGEKAELARRAGADEIIIYTQTNFDEEVVRRTDGRRVDVVYDGVGRVTFEQSRRSLKPLGLLALYGAASGPVLPFHLGRLGQMGSLYITRPIISKDYVRTREELTAIMDPVFEMYLVKKLEVLIGPAYTLERAAEAHRDLESRKSTGKLVLSIGG